MSEVQNDAQEGAAEQARTSPRVFIGRVVSEKMTKTVAVEVERMIRHPRYGKYVRRTIKLLAHDESSESHVGDVVTITPCRPFSKRKAWRVLKVVKKAGVLKGTAA